MADYRRLDIEFLDDGVLEGRLYPAPGATAAVLWVGGVGGGWDTPARGLYPALSAELTREGIASLRLKFRNARDVTMGVEDLLAGVRYLQHEGFTQLALVGHSLGGAVVIRAAAESPQPIATVVALAAQSYGAQAVVDRLGPDTALLLLHGEADAILPSHCSADLFQAAREPKSLRLYPGAGHTLEEVAAAVHDEVGRWLRDHLLPTEDRH